MHRVLLVDGDARSLRLLEVSLRQAGYDVATAGTAAEALTQLTRDPVDVVLCDAELAPEQGESGPLSTEELRARGISEDVAQADGLELLRLVRKDPGGADLPFIVLLPPTEAGNAEKLRAVQLGASDLLTKPVFLKEALTRIEMLLEKRAQRGEPQAGFGGQVRFGGELSGTALLDLLQTMDIGRKSGVAHCRNGRGQHGALYFVDGRVVDAELDRVRGPEVVYRLVTWREGEYHVDLLPLVRPARIDLSASALLLEATRRLAEWNRLCAVLPPLTSVLIKAPLATGATQPESMPAEIQDVFASFDGMRTIQEVLDLDEDLPLDALGRLAAVAKLVAARLLVSKTRAEPRAANLTPPPLSRVAPAISPRLTPAVLPRLMPSPVAVPPAARLTPPPIPAAARLTPPPLAAARLTPSPLAVQPKLTPPPVPAAARLTPPPLPQGVLSAAQASHMMRVSPPTPHHTETPVPVGTSATLPPPVRAAEGAEAAEWISQSGLLSIDGNSGLLSIDGNSGLLSIDGNSGLLSIDGNSGLIPIENPTPLPMPYRDLEAGARLTPSPAGSSSGEYAQSNLNRLAHRLAATRQPSPFATSLGPIADAEAGQAPAHGGHLSPVPSAGQAAVAVKHAPKPVSGGLIEHSAPVVTHNTPSARIGSGTGPGPAPGSEHVRAPSGAMPAVPPPRPRHDSGERSTPRAASTSGSASASDAHKDRRRWVRPVLTVAAGLGLFCLGAGMYWLRQEMDRQGSSTPAFIHTEPPAGAPQMASTPAPATTIQAAPPGPSPEVPAPAPPAAATAPVPINEPPPAAEPQAAAPAPAPTGEAAEPGTDAPARAPSPPVATPLEGDSDPAYHAAIDRARAAQQHGRMVQAKNAVREALKLQPKSAEAITLQAQIALEEGDADKAAYLAKRALGQSPPDALAADANLVLGTVEQARGNTGKARGYFKKYLILAPEGDRASDVKAVLRRGD